MVQCGGVGVVRNVSVRATAVTDGIRSWGCHAGDAVGARRRLGVGEQAAAGAARHGQHEARKKRPGTPSLYTHSCTQSSACLMILIWHILFGALEKVLCAATTFNSVL